MNLCNQKLCSTLEKISALRFLNKKFLFFCSADDDRSLLRKLKRLPYNTQLLRRLLSLEYPTQMVVTVYQELMLCLNTMFKRHRKRFDLSLMVSGKSTVY